MVLFLPALPRAHLLSIVLDSILQVASENLGACKMGGPQISGGLPPGLARVGSG